MANMDLVNLFGGLFGAGGNALALSADLVSNDKTSGFLGAAAGLLGTTSGGLGLTKSIDDYKKSENGKQKGSAISGMIGSGAGILGGLADMGSGLLKAFGKDKDANGEDTILTKSLGWASNILGLIGSGAGLAQSSFDVMDANNSISSSQEALKNENLSDKEKEELNKALDEAKQKKGEAINGLVGNSAGGIGGLFGLAGNIMGGDRGEKASFIGSMIGNGGGLLTGLLGLGTTNSLAGLMGIG